MPPSGHKYTDNIDFQVLALQDVDFAKVLKTNGQLDFSKPESVLQLTKSLLNRDFGLKLELPPDRLCPPVPNRQNYILWIQSLLDTTSDSYSECHQPERQVLGLDIGTGASCIYPLLGCAQYPKWKFAGSDIDDKSLQFARQNIRANNLQDRIRLLQTKPSDPLMPLDRLGFECIDFSICNPPFYASKSELVSMAESKQRPPFSACTGSETEMVTEGGEVFFVSRMIEESLALQNRVQWHTSMLGKLSSVSTLVSRLKEKKIDNYAVTEFVQGSKTRRWGIAWSFESLRPNIAVARGIANGSGLPKAVLPFPSEYLISLDNKSGKEDVGRQVNVVLSELPLKWMWKPNLSTGVGFCNKAVWSRQARRHAAKAEDSAMESSSDEEDMALGFKIRVEEANAGQGCTTVNIRWLKGHDSVLFTSFCGMLKRKLET